MRERVAWAGLPVQRAGESGSPVKMQARGVPKPQEETDSGVRSKTCHTTKAGSF